MRRIAPLVVAAVLVFGIGAAASAQGRIALGYWPQDTEVTFAAEESLPQVVKSPTVVASGAASLLPKLTLWGEYATSRAAEGKQGNSEFTVAGSQTLIVGSFEALNESGLSLSPAVGYLTASNKYDWPVGESSVSYTVGYSGLVISGLASVQLAPGFSARATVLHGPRLTVRDTSENGPDDSYTSALTDVTAAVPIDIMHNAGLEVGYRGISQLARSGNAEVWERTSSGFFAAASLRF